MLKLQRNYRIEFEIGEREGFSNFTFTEKLIVEYPISLNFTVERNTLAQANQGNFVLYNLSPTTQAKLWKDRQDPKKAINVKFYAGYGDTMPLLFYGRVLECYSYRSEGSVDFITEIQANDLQALYQYGFSNYTFQKGTDAKNVINTLLYEIPTLEIGYISSSIPPLKSNQTFLGQTLDLIRREYAGYTVFVDKGRLYVLDENEVLPNQIQVITSQSGLLGTPRRSDTNIVIQMLFEPSIVQQQAIEVLSDVLPWLNQRYRVIGITHSGTISPVETGKLITTLTLAVGKAPFKKIKDEGKSYSEGTTGQWRKPTNIGKISSPFGRRKAPKEGASTEHKGIDIDCGIDTTVVAPNNGTVIFAGYKGGYGKTIMIDHGQINNKRVVSLYGHLNTIKVNANQKVFSGNEIALSGNTGNTTGPHLHFEITEDGIAINPSKYIGNY